MEIIREITHRASKTYLKLFKLMQRSMPCVKDQERNLESTSQLDLLESSPYKNWLLITCKTWLNTIKLLLQRAKTISEFIKIKTPVWNAILKCLLQLTKCIITLTPFQNRSDCLRRSILIMPLVMPAE